MTPENISCTPLPETLSKRFETWHPMNQRVVFGAFYLGDWALPNRLLEAAGRLRNAVNTILDPSYPFDPGPAGLSQRRRVGVKELDYAEIATEHEQIAEVIRRVKEKGVSYNNLNRKVIDIIQTKTAENSSWVWLIAALEP